MLDRMSLPHRLRLFPPYHVYDMKSYGGGWKHSSITGQTSQTFLSCPKSRQIKQSRELGEAHVERKETRQPLQPSNLPLSLHPCTPLPISLSLIDERLQALSIICQSSIPHPLLPEWVLRMGKISICVMNYSKLLENSDSAAIIGTIRISVSETKGNSNPIS